MLQVKTVKCRFKQRLNSDNKDKLKIKITNCHY